jgi:hypothetical protein
MRTRSEKSLSVYDMRAGMKPKIIRACTLSSLLERQIKLNEAIQFPQ